MPTCLVAQDPENGVYCASLARSYNALGVAHWQTNRRDRLEAVCREAEAALASVVRDPPRQLTGLRALYYLADLHRLAAVADHLAGDRGAARPKYDRAIGILGRVLGLEPSYREARLCRFGLHRGLAFLLEESGRPGEALREWDAALEFAAGDTRDEAYRQITRIERAGAQLRLGERGRALAEIHRIGDEEKLGGPCLLQLAYVCCAALEPASAAQRDGLTALALGCLRRCRATGFFDEARRRDEVRTAPQLAPLRSRPEFADLLGGPKPRP